MPDSGANSQGAEHESAQPVLRCPRDGTVLASSGSAVPGSRCAVCEGVYVAGTEIYGTLRGAGVSAEKAGGLRFAPPDCPRCGAGMEPRLIAGLEIDLCAPCSAAWLDRGELAKLNRYLGQDPASAAFPYRDSLPDSHGGAGIEPPDKRGKRGFMEAVARDMAFDVGTEAVSGLLMRLARHFIGH